MKTLIPSLIAACMLLSSSVQAQQTFSREDEFKIAQYVAAIVQIGRDHCNAGSVNDVPLAKYLQERNLTLESVSKGELYKGFTGIGWDEEAQKKGALRACDGIIGQFRRDKAKLPALEAFFR